MSNSALQSSQQDNPRPHQHDTSYLNADSVLPPPDLSREIEQDGKQYVAGGAFGDVYRCRYNGGSKPQEVAVKVLRIDEEMTDRSNKMLRRELGIWRRLSHKNIVPFIGIVYGFGRHGTMSPVSLWMPNECLRKFLMLHNDKLDTTHRLQILLDVARGLRYLHSFPIVHGDLYPNNVLLDDDYTARLTDFGYASLLGNGPEALAYLQRSTAQPGALRWVAPELVNPEGTSPLSTECDIYSFGCMALQVLSGKQPWPDVHRDIAIVVLLANGKTPDRPESPKMDDSHWDFIRHCWTPSKNRPAAHTLMMSLERFIERCQPSRSLRDVFGSSMVVPLQIDVERPLTASDQLAESQRTLRVWEKKHQCETMITDGLIYDAVEHLLEIINTISEDLQHDESIANWLEDFRNQCVSQLRAIGDQASSADNHTKAFSAYSTILLLTSPPNTVLMGWARMGLRCHSANEVLRGVDKFVPPRFYFYRAICDILEEDDRVIEAIECFQMMMMNLLEETHLGDRPQWELDFQQRCVKKLEKHGDTAKDHGAAIGYYSSALSFGPTNINDIIVKCCKARASLLEEELVSVTKVIERDPLDYKGYKKKHSILHSMGRFREAFSAFGMMLSTMKNSADPQICALRSRYLDTTPCIRQVVYDTIRDIPRVLIDTVSGRLYDRTQQAAAFEEHLLFDELRSTMTTRDRLDYSRIKQEVEKFYQYVMFSHKWLPAEPTFEMVEGISIYELPESPTIEKLINFCDVVRSRRFRWAWCDTCCVNRADKGGQQEFITAMFRWYSRAAFTIVHLLGVFSESQQEGDLRKSIWNTRAWTFQEYIASRVIQFYTEDWEPYLGLDVFNHKESPVILSEMEQATQLTAKRLAMIQPGIDMVREKLFLTSKRNTAWEEDMAYSLFGIFNVAIPVRYGEGNQAVGRLLEHILTRSDNVAILAWTGTSGSRHSYLPSNFTVYDQILPPHVPRPIENTEMDRMVADTQSSFPDSSPIVMLYQHLLDLPSLSVVSGRLLLPGLIFPLTGLLQLVASNPDSSVHVYCAKVPILGEVQIETKDDSLGTQRLVLVHPWISSLLNEDYMDGRPLFDLDALALRLLVRLRQPFGALLLASQKHGQYKRVATDSFIQVQIRAEASLSELMVSTDTVEVQ